MPERGISLTLEVARGRLQSIVDEAGIVLMRTAFSKVVREAKDFACAILDANGATVVQSVQSVPVFFGTMSNTARALIKSNLAAGLRDGDVVGTNDPWLGTGQLFDLTLLAPVYLGRTCVAYAGVVAHLSDIGGRGFVPDSAEIFQEGLRIPLCRVADANGVVPILADILAANVRYPREVLGDVNAMLNAITTVGKRAAALIDENGGPGQFKAVCEDLEERTTAHMERAKASLTPGVYTARSGPIGEGVAQFHAQVSVTVEKDGPLKVDFAGTSAQVPYGINSTYSYTQSYVLYALKCLLAPNVPFNAGIMRAIDVLAPEGTVVNCTFPAAGTARSVVGHVLPALIYEALATCIGEEVVAPSGAPRPTVHYETRLADFTDRTNALIIVAGGMGARYEKDGVSAVNFPTNTEWIPIEVVEATCPVRFEEKELVCDSGGDGRFRGGLGQRVSVRCLSDFAVAAVQAQWLKEGPAGVNGGLRGGRAEVTVNGVVVPNPNAAPLELRRGDVLSVTSPGGGGFGPPLARDQASRAADLSAGYVSGASPANVSRPPRGKAALSGGHGRRS